MNTAGPVGKSTVRIDALAKATGALLFPSDLAVDGMLSVRVLRAAHPHALVLGIHTSLAERLAGVCCVLTAKDVPGQNGYGLVFPDMPVLCADRVRYMGDALAIVAAETDEVACQALDLITVEYEVLPVVTDPRMALSPDSPRLHPNGNLCSEIHLGHGDVALGFSRADYIVEGEYGTSMQEHIPLEVEAGVAWFDDVGVLTVYAGGQNPFSDRFQIARALALPEEEVRVINPMVGGSFGDKEEITVQIHLALAALRTRRPCRLVWDRSESIVASVKRHPFRLNYKTGVTKDGHLAAIEVSILADTGAYASLGPAVLANAVEQCCGPYYYPNTKIDARLAYTNNCVSGAFRGFGNPQVVVAIEQQMDRMAEAIGMDRIAFRRLNVVASGQLGGAGHPVAGRVSLRTVLDAAAEGELYSRQEEVKRSSGHQVPWKRRGVGVASIWQCCGLGAGLPRNIVDAEAHVGLQDNGRYLLRVGCPDVGQGNATAFLQMAANELGCSVADIDLSMGDSLGPDSGPTNSSRTVYAVGTATVNAAIDLRTQILAAAKRLGQWQREPHLDGGQVREEERSIPLAELAAEVGPFLGKGRFHPGQPEPLAPGVPHDIYTYGAQVALVEVDLLTGEIDMLRVDNYLDAGRIINPDGATGQSEGGIAQGVGFALLENLIVQEGRVLNPSMSTYTIPSVADVPREVNTFLMEESEPLGPYGARGIGEISISPTAAAILNGVYDAVGVRFNRVPVTPEMMLEALATAEG